MKGIDISHWQGAIDWHKVKLAGIEFAIIKATQGRKFIDNRFLRNKTEIRRQGILCGYYHFANGSNATEEAKHFIKTVGDIRKGELVVLDWEIQHKRTVDWCLKWLKEVEKLVGFKPLIYLNKATLKRNNWKKVVKNNNGLWIASYGVNTGFKGFRPPSYQWKFWAIWQYTSRGRVRGVNGNVDLNYTSMNLKTLKKYGKQEADVCTHCCPKHCK